MPLKDVLGRVCSQFNHMVTARKHKIDSGVKAMAYNLTLGCACEMGRFCNKFLFDIVLPNLYRIQLNLFWVVGFNCYEAAMFSIDFGFDSPALRPLQTSRIRQVHFLTFLFLRIEVNRGYNDLISRALSLQPFPTTSWRRTTLSLGQPVDRIASRAKPCLQRFWPWRMKLRWFTSKGLQRTSV